MLFAVTEMETKTDNEKGQGLLEYAIILILVVIAVLAFLFIAAVFIGVALAIVAVIVWVIFGVINSVGLIPIGSLALSQILLVI